MESRVEFAEYRFDFAEVYKQIMSSFNTTAIPSSCISVIQEIIRVADTTDHRVYARSLLDALPSIHRAVIENNIRLCKLNVSQAMTHPQQMDMVGLSKGMMPCLILRTVAKVVIKYILAAFVLFGFTNFKDKIYI